jgi:hypothetical protein
MASILTPKDFATKLFDQPRQVRMDQPPVARAIPMMLADLAPERRQFDGQGGALSFQFQNCPPGQSRRAAGKRDIAQRDDLRPPDRAGLLLSIAWQWNQKRGPAVLSASA